MSKTKQYLKAAGGLLLFGIYRKLWIAGTTKQRWRMVLSWVLFMAAVGGANSAKRSYYNWETMTPYDGTRAEFDVMVKQSETLGSLFLVSWIILVLYSWNKRSKEST